jgi:hypothetical protein
MAKPGEVGGRSVKLAEVVRGPHVVGAYAWMPCASGLDLDSFEVSEGVFDDKVFASWAIVEMCSHEVALLQHQSEVSMHASGACACACICVGCVKEVLVSWEMQGMCALVCE